MMAAQKANYRAYLIVVNKDLYCAARGKWEKHLPKNVEILYLDIVDSKIKNIKCPKNRGI